jgi:hypothetical protein
MWQGAGASTTLDVGMSYGLVLLGIAVLLAVRHLGSSTASRRSKRLVGGFVGAAILVPYVWPNFFPLTASVLLLSPLVQFTVCFYVIFHQAVWGAGGEHAGPSHTRHSKKPSEHSSEQEC